MLLPSLSYPRYVDELLYWSGKRMKFDDYLQGELVPKRLPSSWVTNTKFVFQSDDGSLAILDTANDSVTTLVTNHTLVSCWEDVLSCAPVCARSLSRGCRWFWCWAANTFSLWRGERELTEKWSEISARLSFHERGHNISVTRPNWKWAALFSWLNLFLLLFLVFLAPLFNDNNFFLLFSKTHRKTTNNVSPSSETN